MTKTLPIIPLAALLLAVAGCGKDEQPSAPQPPEDPVVKRMQDEKYVKAINDKIAERKDIMVRLTAARRELEKAKAENADASVVSQREAAVKALAREFQVNRGKTQLLVREQMNKDQDAYNEQLKAYNEQLQEKKGK